ncbi:MAG: HpcH/HpaI aldolase/citrate lyase family protein [Actinobacteria bacterium]|nr:HpcH/HpaI aldolase/citrate lyase family protein [Actinomycetota bacterium]NCG36548.1 HpcH/HpaI aldolase/citrate lyase family protein [Actinomycetota bacterium]
MTSPGRLRSLLFAPAVRPDLLRKMPRTGADAIVIDLEDATPPNAKADGRANLVELAPELVEQIAVYVRVNDDTSEWHEDDLDSVPAGLQGIVVPKIETIAALDALQDRLRKRGLSDLVLIGGIETALGVADARELLAHPVIDAAYFGAEDFIADMGGVRTPGNAEVHYARSHVALAGRLAEKLVIDQIVADFRDDDRCDRECREARALGYGGKLCIHPAQVAIAHAAFTPSQDEVDRARRMLAAYAEATAGGVASIAFEGQMVDEPVAIQARRILTLSEE